MLLITEWQEFGSPDFDDIKKRLKIPLFFDGRNQFKQQRIQAMGFEYIQIGITT
jgi:UDPglucose 6-dehydrogenase